MKYKKSTSKLDQYIILLQEYYHVSSRKSLLRVLVNDFCLSVFLRSGSGLFTSVLKGVIGKFFIKSGYPLLIGRRAKLVHSYNMIFGHHVWLRDDVILVAIGRMIIGNNVVIGENSALWADKKGLIVGDNTGLGKNCYIAALGGKIDIGRNVLVADGVRMYSLSHKYQNPKKTILEQGYEAFTIIIEDNVWIGSGAIIYKNVRIGTGAVIGAHSVVTKDVPPFTVFAGNPGKVIKRLR